MAKIPNETALGERPEPRPAGGLAQYRVESAPFEEPGRALMRAGAVLESDADRLFAQYKHEQEKIDTLRAEEAFTKLRERQLDLTVGEQDGYERVKGSAAVGRPLVQDYTRKFEDVSAQIEGTLANDTQRAKFKQRSAVAGLQFKEGVARHLVKESDVYAKEVFDGTIRSEIRQATSQWQDPLNVGLSIARVNEAVNTQAERQSWPAELREAERLKAEGQIHGAVIRQALASGNFVYAQKWYEQHKEDIDAPTAAAVQRAVEDGTQKQLSNGYRSTMLAVQGNYKALAALRDDVLKDPTLSDDRRNALVGPIQNQMITLERREEARRDRWERQTEKAITGFNADTLAGYPGTDPKRGLELISATKGTALEAQARQAVGLSNATQQFASLSPVTQARQLAEVEAAVRKDPSKFDRKIVDAWRSFHESLMREAEVNPTGLLARQGLVELLPLDIAKPDATAPALAQRFAVAREGSARFGVPMKPLQPDEVQALSNKLRETSPENQAVYFGQLKSASAGDNGGYMAVMGQLAPDNPVAAVAGSHAGLDRPQNAALILRGQAALQPNKRADGQPGKSMVSMPPEPELERQFKDVIGDAFAGKPEQRSAAYQAVKAAYAGQAIDSPKDADPKAVNRTFFSKAVKTVLGDVVDYKNRTIIPPYGYDSAMFEDGVARLLDQQLDQGMKSDFSRDRLLNLPLVNKGDGRYIFMSGDSRVFDKAGREIVIDFNRGLPFRTSGTGASGSAPSAEDMERAARSGGAR